MPRVYAFTDYGGRENEHFVDLPKPLPEKDQLVIRVKAAGVNPKDWKERAGRYRSSEEPSGLRAMGSEVAGIIDSVGDNVATFEVGEPVFGASVRNGAFSEYAVLSFEEAGRKPDSVSFIEASTLSIAGVTAYSGIEALRLHPGETLLIIGIGGGVGISAAQFALARGVRVVGTASMGKKELVESFGAMHVAYGPGTVERLLEAIPEGVSAIFDTVGDDAMRELGVLAPLGRVVTAAGAAAAEEFGGMKISRIRGSAVLDKVAQMITSGFYRPVITEVFPFDRVGSALERLESGHVAGKLVVEIP